MSKKSRRRNKKLLALLALAGGAAFAGRGKGAVSTVGQPVGVDRTSTNQPPIGGTDHIPPVKKKFIVKKPPKKIIDHGMAYQSSRAAGDYGDHVEAPTRVNGVLIKGRANAEMGRKIPFHPAQGNVKPAFTMKGDDRGWRYASKKGGRVTGIAKRGFGRALMKGKK